MAQEPNNIVLEHLREIRADLRAVREDIKEIKLRLSAMESHMAGFHTTVAVRARQ